MEKPTYNNTTTPKKDDLLTKHYSYYSSHNKPSSSSSLISSFFCLPITSLLALFILILLVYNSFTIFFYFVPSFHIENSKQIHHNKKFPTSPFPSSDQINYALKETSPPTISSKTHLKLSRNSASITQQKGPKPQNSKWVPKAPPLEAPPMVFSKRVKQFFVENSCKVRVFMTWISSLESFGDREKFCIESLFKFNPNACLLIVSKSMDTYMGTKVILEPFLSMNFKIMAISPDFRFVFKSTSAAHWYDELEKGNVKTGDISLGQNLSNLLRLTLLYKYGGIYMDTDFIVLKKLNKLRNSIGAQMIDAKTKKWSRLNNAILIFDKKHPLLSLFIQEFASTFDGNKWGHNGPYLVSRVIERINGTMEGVKNFTILPPSAFYVVDWIRIVDLFQDPKDEAHMKWIDAKIKSIEDESYAVHLWNRQSKDCKVEVGSVISHLIKISCVFCNSSYTIANM